MGSMTCLKSHNKGRDSTVTPLPEICKQVAQIQWTRALFSWATGYGARRHSRRGSVESFSGHWRACWRDNLPLGGREERNIPSGTQHGRSRQVQRPLASTSPDSWIITSEDFSESLFPHLLNGVHIFTNFLGAGFEMSLTLFLVNSIALHGS